MKKFNQVLGEDEKLRLQLEMLISPTCSCKQAETCVVSRYYLHREKRQLYILKIILFLWADVSINAVAQIILHSQPGLMLLIHV